MGSSYGEATSRSRDGSGRGQFTDEDWRRIKLAGRSSAA
jgi:hypothetical protein